MRKTIERKFNFFQLSKDFFRDDKIEELEQLELINHDDPCDYLAIYLKMLTSSVSTFGLFYEPNKKVSSAMVKRKIKFTSGRSPSDDLLIVDRCLVALSDLNLISHDDEAIFLNEFEKLVMNKQDKEKFDVDERVNIKNKISTILERDNVCPINNKMVSLLSSNFYEELTSGLIFKKYISVSDKASYMKTFKDLSDNYNLTEIELSKGVKVFLHRLERIDLAKINDKENYLIETLKHIIFDEIRTGDISFNSSINKLCEYRLIFTAKEIKDFTSALKEIAKEKGISGDELFKKINLSLINLSILKDKGLLNAESFKRTILSSIDGQRMNEKLIDEELQRIMNYDWVHWES